MIKHVKSLTELNGRYLKLREDSGYQKEYLRQHELSSKLGSLTEDDENDETSSSSKTFDDEKKSLKTGNVNTNQIIDKLNTIRSGKSFKDELIKGSMDQYISSLKAPEKVALFAFLKGIAQIVTGEISGEKAIEPSDPGPDVEMKKSKFKRTIKPVVVKTVSGKKSKENTEAPVPAPIVPKK